MCPVWTCPSLGVYIHIFTTTGATEGSTTGSTVGSSTGTPEGTSAGATESTTPVLTTTAASTRGTFDVACRISQSHGIINILFWK
jgi:hypothetical protein